MQTLSTRNYAFCAAPDWAVAILRFPQGGSEPDIYFFEESFGQEEGMRYQRIDNPSNPSNVCTYGRHSSRAGQFVAKLPPLAPPAPALPTLKLVVTAAYLTMPQNDGSYFQPGDIITIEEGHKLYGIQRGSVALHKAERLASCDAKWVADCLAAGGFVEPEDYIPAAPTSGLYLSPTGNRQVSLKLEPAKADKAGQIVLEIGGVYRKVRLDAVTARDMASDLYRMARELEKDDN